jgi:branched-chain amino acid aminotransferase
MKLDWQSLGFSYVQTRSFIHYTWTNGRWGEGVVSEQPYLNLHIAATALHYGQSCFEGLKAFACRDGQIRIFRMDENARRMDSSARRLRMPEVPEELFMDAVRTVVRENRDFVPPYGTGGSLYIRPLLFGSGARIGVQPADEYIFLVLVTPVGNYYKGGLKPVSAVIMPGYDRCAPGGLGSVKAAGNYSADLEPSQKAKQEGYPITLYLDAREHKYVDEFGTSNFIAITKDRRYVTPASPSILPSITNKTLMALAADLGLPVEKRPVAFSEVGGFAEVAACGTAVVITPVNRIVHGEQVIEVGPREGVGPVFQQLYDQVRGIQVGDLPDPHGWHFPLD